MTTFIARLLLVIFSASIGYVIAGTFEPVRASYEIIGLFLGVAVAFVSLAADCTSI